MKRLHNKKPSSVGKRYPGQQQNSREQFASANDNKSRESDDKYLPESTAENTDTLTVLRCCTPHVATKTHQMTENGVETKNFKAGKFFDCHQLPVSNIFGLSSILKSIESLDHVFAIRGLPLPHVVLEKPHPRRKRKSGGNYLSPANGHYYFMVDIDKLNLPDGLVLTPDNTARVVDFTISMLPEEFHNVSFHWQLSSSAGIRNLSVVSIHLWFWLAKPTTDRDLKRWGNAVNKAKGYKLIDTGLFDDVQPHYTAAPIFVGMDDPFPERSGLVEKSTHEVDLVLPAEAPLISRPRMQKDAGTYGSSQATGSSGHGFDHKLSQIGDHEGGEGFHEPIIRAAASYVATHGCDADDSEHLYQILRERILAADRSKHSTAEVEQRASREHLKSAIDSAIAKFGDTPTGGARLKDGIPPHYAAATSTKTKAAAKLDRLLKKIL